MSSSDWPYHVPAPSGHVRSTGDIRRPTPGEIYRLGTRDLGEPDGVDEKEFWEDYLGEELG